MFTTKRKLILIVGLVFLILVVIFLVIVSERETGEKKKEEQKQTEDKEFFTTAELKGLVGGTYLGDGFEINYLESQEIFYIKITKNPFAENKDEAFLWFQDKGLDITQTPHGCVISRGVEVTAEELEKCSKYKK